MRGSCLACCRCCYCLLPVRLDDDTAHPGHGIVEQLPGAAAREVGDLGLVHRHCAESLGTRTHRHALRCGMAARRARLERATERYEQQASVPERHDRLGIEQAGVDGWPVTWRVRKMRYAARAARRYFDSGVPDHY